MFITVMSVERLMSDEQKIHVQLYVCELHNSSLVHELTE